jgi:hypothetical protein
MIRRVNFRKVKASKAAWLAALVLGLLVPGASAPPLMRLLDSPRLAPLAYAEPPPLDVGLAAGIAAGEREQATGKCANVRRELRFEMITAEQDVYPPTWRNPAVCLAVYVPAARR